MHVEKQLRILDALSSATVELAAQNRCTKANGCTRPEDLRQGWTPSLTVIARRHMIPTIRLYCSQYHERAVLHNERHASLEKVNILHCESPSRQWFNDTAACNNDDNNYHWFGELRQEKSIVQTWPASAIGQEKSKSTQATFRRAHASCEFFF